MFGDVCWILDPETEPQVTENDASDCFLNWQQPHHVRTKDKHVYNETVPNLFVDSFLYPSAQPKRPLSSKRRLRLGSWKDWPLLKPPQVVAKSLALLQGNTWVLPSSGSKESAESGYPATATSKVSI